MLLLLFLSLSSAIACYDTFDNKAISGNWYMTVDGSVDLCVATCNSMSNCAAITYTTTFSQTCTLWSNITAIVDISNVSTLKRSSDPKCAANATDKCTECNYKDQSQMNGKETAYKSVQTLSDCTNLCNSLKSCKGYSTVQGAFQIGCTMYLNAIGKSSTGPTTLTGKDSCSCSNTGSAAAGSAPFPPISQMEILGLTLVAIFGIAALCGVIYVILYSYKPMKKSFPRWHSTNNNSPTTPINNNAFSDPYPEKCVDHEKRESVAELRSLNLLDFNNQKGSFRLSLPNGYVKLSDCNGNTNPKE